MNTKTILLIIIPIISIISIISIILYIFINSSPNNTIHIFMKDGKVHKIVEKYRQDSIIGIVANNIDKILANTNDSRTIILDLFRDNKKIITKLFEESLNNKIITINNIKPNDKINISLIKKTHPNYSNIVKNS